MDAQNIGEAVKEGWHLDKKVPLSIIFALLVQSVALIVWAVNLDSRVSRVERDYINQASSIEVMKNNQSSITVSLARMEERMIVTAENVREIKNGLRDNKK